MAKHKGKIIAGLIVVLLLVVAFVWGGNRPDSEAKLPQDNALSINSDAAKQDDSQKLTDGDLSGHVSDADADTAADEDPLLAERPSPVEPDEVTIGETAYSCTLTVRCDTILSNMDYLHKEKAELVPEDGIIFPATLVTFYEGESVFDVLQREMQAAAIHMEFVNTPLYNAVYIEAINNLYEFDCGELSGWVYKVNDWFPNYGCSRYQLQDGDVIEWLFTCDLGKDVGGGNLGGGLQGGN